ncbi:hypothetical protein P4O66_001800 [Electrophorus voltai]|uniref:PiggyBac transposable element-derived protein domain-containing protein n=1 Tax=Electrophorus voltai TaxID=2609070 RepID=A0AAD9DUC4_9TELE|nr:hypothetical protein P4O66_001800 [Electrophorus voltai]
MKINQLNVQVRHPYDITENSKWFEIPFRQPESDEEEELQEDEGESELKSTAAAEETADSASYIAGGGCNIILVTGNGIKHEEYEDESYYATSNNCSETTSTDSDIDFSDLEEEEHPDLFSSYDLLDEECISPDFWGEPDQLPDYGMYWASDIFIGNAGFKKTMTARRFEKLNQNLHLCDRLSEPAKGELGYDGLYKIRPLLDIVGNTMWDAYLPNRCLTIDECAIATKGRFSPTQYMPSKPLRKGLKVWMLCDSRSGYCHRTRLYVGKPGDDMASASLGHRVVTSLVRGLESRHHHLFMDSFFTSVPLLQRLLQDGLYACGPTNPYRRGYPDALRPRSVGKLAPAPGIVGIGPGGRRDGETEAAASLSDLGVARPLPLLLYQENMRGVDLCDQLRECYQSRGGVPPAGFSGKEFTQRHFRVRLAQQLIGDYQGARGMERAARKRHADSPLEYGHRLERMSERSRRCRNCTNKGLRHESVFGCKICNVHLCRGGCFSEFHK